MLEEKRMNVKIHPNAMLVIFGSGKHPIITPIIKIRTNSNYSHVAYIDPLTGLLIESAGGIGVRVTTFEKFISKYPKYHVAVVFVPCAKYTRQFIINQLGKPYDKKAIWGYLFNRDWNDPNAWTCSELLAAGAAVYRLGSLNRISPQHLHHNSRPTYFDFKLLTRMILSEDEINASSPELKNLKAIEKVKSKLLEHGKRHNWPTTMKRPRFNSVAFD